MQALILAGGEGTRLRPLTVYTPKPIVAIANRPFLHYQLELLQRAGIKDVSLALGYQPNKIADLFGDGQEYGVHIRYVVESTALGTAGGYKNAADHGAHTTVVFNGDIITDIDLKAVFDFHRRQKALATIVLAPVENPAIYGLVETDSDCRVRRFIEKPNPEEITCNTINAGIYLLEPGVLNHVPSDEKFSFEYQLFPALLQANEPVYGFIWPGYWIDIGTPQHYLKANQDLLNGRIKAFEVERTPHHSTQEATRETTKEAFKENGEPPQIDRTSVIDPTCTIKQGVEIISSVLGPNCYIEERARIENSVLLGGARVGRATEITGSIVGKSAIIGRFAKVENSVLGDKSSLSDYTIV